jgi:hypothetical protein
MRMRRIILDSSQCDIYLDDALAKSDRSPRVIKSPRYASLLRHELRARNIKFAEDHGFLYEQTMGSSFSVIYRADEEGRHGNFHPASYQPILRNPDWKRRLLKKHTTAQKALLSHDPSRVELDSCNSSDALLMNIFCHPGTSSAQSALRSYLAVEANAKLVFGYKPRVPLKDGKIDCTEIDLRVGDLMVEAKLTENDFQTARWELAGRYRDFEDVFNPQLLPRAGDKLRSYQLVRGILAAFAEESCRYCLVCDERRTDLIELWSQVLFAIRLHRQRYRCTLVTWQELSTKVPNSLQCWLGQKYGINPSKQ